MVSLQPQAQSPQSRVAKRAAGRVREAKVQRQTSPRACVEWLAAPMPAPVARWAKMAPLVLTMPPALAPPCRAVLIAADQPVVVLLESRLRMTGPAAELALGATQDRGRTRFGLRAPVQLGSVAPAPAPRGVGVGGWDCAGETAAARRSSVSPDASGRTPRPTAVARGPIGPALTAANYPNDPNAMGRVGLKTTRLARAVARPARPGCVEPARLRRRTC